MTNILISIMFLVWYGVLIFLLCLLVSASLWFLFLAVPLGIMITPHGLVMPIWMVVHKE